VNLDYTPDEIRHLSNEEFRLAFAGVLKAQHADRRENQLLYYRPVSAQAEKVHRTASRVVGVGGGNGSSKTETCLVELIMCATGVFPDCLRDTKEKFRGPINCRVVVESLTTTLHQVILPKLQWWKWTGVDQPGGDRGHWGWVPRLCLKGCDWDKSWSEKLRTLTVLCRDPEDYDKVIGESIIQFMSHEQDPTDFASGDFDIILHDEPPKLAIWQENEARTMRVNGRMFLAMTWPDDPSIPVDWIFDKIYDRSKSDKDTDWIELWSTDNPHLDQSAIAAQMERWDSVTKAVRIYGRPIRFSNRIHPVFTDTSQWWCFSCGKETFAVEEKCSDCGGEDITEYCHVSEFDVQPHWPTIWLLDPHPRKPHMFLWVQIDPSDDWWAVAEGEVEGDPSDVRVYCEEIEQDHGLWVTQRLIDPNMGRSPSGIRRDITWQDEFDMTGMACDLADDSAVGRERVNQFLKPDKSMGRPRLHIHSRCQNTIWQMKRYVWSEYKRSLEKDIKQIPRDKYDDYPTLLKYLANFEPAFGFLRHGAPVIRRAGRRAGY